MSLKTILNYSPNFSLPKRNKNKIKFIILHYTGMKSEKRAIDRLTNLQSQVSSHFLIKNNGEILTLVPELYIAWHCGFSSWKNYKQLNKNSIGIEITNPGHQYGYENFKKEQINSLVKLCKFLSKKYKIKKKNILGHSDIAPTRKKDPGEKFPWEYLAKKDIGIWHYLSKIYLQDQRGKKINELEKKKSLDNLFKIGYSKNFKNKDIVDFAVKAFQRRFRPSLINGKIDRECLLILRKLTKFDF